MKKLIIALPLLAALFATHAALAGSVVVIVNSGNSQNASMADIKNIYMDKTVTWGNGGKIAVYNLPAEDTAAEIFAGKVLGMSARDAAAAESNRIISNASRNPQQTKRDALVASIVAKTPNAIGYISKEQAEGKSGLRVLFTFE
jgi:ABC-type phosphate transport system substrate-binding protein